jgi:hypothetical protein
LNLKYAKQKFLDDIFHLNTKMNMENDESQRRGKIISQNLSMETDLSNNHSNFSDVNFISNLKFKEFLIIKKENENEDKNIYNLNKLNTLMDNPKINIFNVNDSINNNDNFTKKISQ